MINLTIKFGALFRGGQIYQEVRYLAKFQCEQLGAGEIQCIRLN